MIRKDRRFMKPFSTWAITSSQGCGRGRFLTWSFRTWQKPMPGVFSRRSDAKSLRIQSSKNTLLKWSRAMKIKVPVFPGSNCDHDTEHVFGTVLKQDVELVWHKEEKLGDCDLVILPGGFAHGDYLRTGAMARFSPIMKSVEKFAREGGLVFGICNGFQILCEAGLLPGALMKNACLQFRSEHIFLR